MSDKVSLEEVDEVLEDSETFDQLRTNLQNLQSRQGNHIPLFTMDVKSNQTPMQRIQELLRHIEDAYPETNIYALDPKFSELPDSIEETARRIYQSN